MIYAVSSGIISALAQIPFMPMMNNYMRAVMTADPDRMIEAMRTMMQSPAYLTFLAVQGVLTQIAAMFFYLSMFGINARAVMMAIEDGKIERPA